MHLLKDYKVILWDFDGVILNSMVVRDIGFKEIFKSYPKDKVDALLTYHTINGGLSRYVKIRYFFEEILKQPISEAEVLIYAEAFSVIMKKELIKKEYLISDSVNFIKNNHSNYKMHIVSGSDGKELSYLCDQLGIANYFITINGSPTPKNKLVKDLLNKYAYEKKDSCLIGDSINDFDAADINGIDFFSYNNEKIKEIGQNITQFELTV